MANPDTAPESTERTRNRARIARLEADMAYFQARLEIIGEPESTNQLAQRKAFKLLHRSIAERVLGAKQQYSRTV